jgi:hypothetical protein
MFWGRKRVHQVMHQGRSTHPFSIVLPRGQQLPDEGAVDSGHVLSLSEEVDPPSGDVIAVSFRPRRVSHQRRLVAEP